MQWPEKAKISGNKETLKEFGNNYSNGNLLLFYFKHQGCILSSKHFLKFFEEVKNCIPKII